MRTYYIDLGSSTIKVYCYENDLKLIEEHSIYFKNDFDREKGISESKYPCQECYDEQSGHNGRQGRAERVPECKTEYDYCSDYEQNGKGQCTGFQVTFEFS